MNITKQLSLEFSELKKVTKNLIAEGHRRIERKRNSHAYIDANLVKDKCYEYGIEKETSDTPQKGNFSNFFNYRNARWDRKHNYPPRKFEIAERHFAAMLLALEKDGSLCFVVPGKYFLRDNEVAPE